MASNVRLGQARLFWCAPERKLKGAKTQVIGTSDIRVFARIDNL